MSHTSKPTVFQVTVECRREVVIQLTAQNSEEATNKAHEWVRSQGYEPLSATAVEHHYHQRETNT